MDRSIARVAGIRFWLTVAVAFGLAVAVPAGVMAVQVSTPTAGEDQVYVDPDNRYQIPIPTNWVAEEFDGYVRIATRDGKISITATIIEAGGATAGIDAAMRLIEPEFENVALTGLLATPATEADDSAFYTFDDGAESGEISQALGRKIGDESVFVLVLRGELEAVKLRQVQVDKIFEGILIRTESAATPVASPAA